MLLMSRDIKFRIYDTDEKEMFYQEDIDYIDFITGIVFIHQEDGYDYLLDYKSDDGKLMQYTGLKDKNGKEVYEGDIIESPLWEVEPYEIVFKDYAFKARDIRKKIMYGSDLFFDIDDLLTGCVGETFEVIGNIYENPELLEGER